jgi:flagellar basal-body rod protein FlgG
MPDGAAIAAASMSLDAERVRIISQNVANATTPGYKRALASVAGYREFGDALAGADAIGWTAGSTAGSALLPTVGYAIDFQDAPTRHTGTTLDLAIEGPGFFEVRDGGGIHYTRQGNLSLDANGVLGLPDGAAISGIGGDIRLDSAAVRIDRQGRIYDGKEALLGQLKLARFDDPSKLIAEGNGRYLQGGAQVQPDGAAISVRQGFLESSNVVSTHEMVKLIETLRHFQGGGQVLRAYDQMREKALSRLGEF